jgi:gliding motility-associated-like protein
VSDEGCSTSSPITVTVQLPDFYIPNTFTPNGDGINDVFTIITGNSVVIKKFTIFNRWGGLMYETADITQYWNGFKDSTDVPVGVYYWILEGEQRSKFFRKAGWVTLIR